ncbi:alpha-amylase [Ceratobasidium sp. AG-Ba]|nr:alpha-amylase [Ceratobasidium sp. AG-Ba]QRW05179.1 alpha-amylase [Ceratobasidium sp. AG-Ba]
MAAECLDRGAKENRAAGLMHASTTKYTATHSFDEPISGLCSCLVTLLPLAIRKMQFNHIFLLQDIEFRQHERRRANSRPVPRARLSSDCCLPKSLPSLTMIGRQAKEQIPRTEVKLLRHHSTSSMDSHSSSNSSDDVPVSPSQPRSGDHSNKKKAVVRPQPVRPRGWKEPEHWEVVQAIERRDVVRLSEIRDHSFHVLLRRVNNTSPLEHAMRIGHTDMAVLILGMFSRWINYLDEEDFARKKVMINLNAIRVNLRFAISRGLQHNQPDLISSYLQTIVMSHGESWLKTAIADVSREVGLGCEGRPVETAINSIKNFFTKELSKAESILAVDEYVANAGCDLLMLGAWTQVMHRIPSAQPIPLHYFARDDRIYQEFADRRRRLRDECRAHLTKKLQWQMKVMKKTVGIRAYGIQQKLEILKEELDRK